MKIMPLGHRTIAFQFCSPISPGIIWTLQTGGTERCNINMSVSMSPTSSVMTVPSLFGVESAGIEEHISMSWREEQ
jgi:hypothetical protein